MIQLEQSRSPVSWQQSRPSNQSSPQPSKLKTEQHLYRQSSSPLSQGSNTAYANPWTPPYMNGSPPQPVPTPVIYPYYYGYYPVTPYQNNPSMMMMLSPQAAPLPPPLPRGAPIITHNAKGRRSSHQQYHVPVSSPLVTTPPPPPAPQPPRSHRPSRSSRQVSDDDTPLAVIAYKMEYDKSSGSSCQSEPDSCRRWSGVHSTEKASSVSSGGTSRNSSHQAPPATRALPMTPPPSSKQQRPTKPTKNINRSASLPSHVHAAAASYRESCPPADSSTRVSADLLKDKPDRKNDNIMAKAKRFFSLRRKKTLR